MKKLSLAALLTSVVLAACGGGSTPTPPGDIIPDVIRAYAVTRDSLYSIVLKGSAADEKVMTLSSTSTITDAAQSGTTLYAATFSNLLRLDTSTQTVTTVGAFGLSNVNALTADSSGKLYAASGSGGIYAIDAATGAATKVADLGSASSGDLAFAPDGTLYATVRTSTATDILARISLSTQDVRVVGETGYTDVFGLDYLYGTLYGRTNAGALITLNTSTGQGTLIRTSSLRFNSL